MSDVPGGLVCRNLADAVSLADAMFKSGLFPDVKSAAQAVVKIIAGMEMGFGPMASMSDVHIIEGKPSLGAHLKAAAIKRSGRYDYRVVVANQSECTLEFSELKGTGKALKWEIVGTVGLTMAEAVERGMTTGRIGLKANWRTSPDDMLFARALSKGYRRYCPDLTAGVIAYDPDEMDNSPTAPEPKRVETVPPPARLETNGSPSEKPEPTVPERPDEDAAVHPRTASEFASFLEDLERPLVAGSYCTVGQLTRRVTEAGNRAGFAGPVLEWQGPALAFGVQEGQAAEAWFRKSGLITSIDNELQRLDIGAIAFTKRLKEKYGTDDPFALDLAVLEEILAKLEKAPSPATPQPVAAASS